MLDDNHNCPVKFNCIVLDGSDKYGDVSDERGQNHKEEICCPGVAYSIVFNAVPGLVAELMIKGRHSDESLGEILQS